jgi:hypothetical protein
VQQAAEGVGQLFGREVRAKPTNTREALTRTFPSRPRRPRVPAAGSAGDAWRGRINLTKEVRIE